MRTILFMITLLFATQSFSQSTYRGAVKSVDQPQNTYSQARVPAIERPETGFKNSERSQEMKEDIKNMRGIMGSSQDVVKARNLLMLKEILDFKMQDATLAPEIEKLKQNREFNTKLYKALNQLDNKKSRNSKNQEVINILNDAGNRIYNSLAN